MALVYFEIETRSEPGAEGKLQRFFVKIRGPLGAGKTSVSLKLAEALGAAYVSIDEILEKNNFEEWGRTYITLRSFIRANELVANKATKLLIKGKPVIFDGNFYYKTQVSDLIKRLSSFKAFVFTLSVPLEVCIQRDAHRNVVFGERAVRLVHKKSAEFQPGVEIDATGDLGAVIDSIIEIIMHDLKELAK